MLSTVIIGYGHLGQYACRQWNKHTLIHALSRSQPQKSSKNTTKLIWHQIELKQNISISEKQNIRCLIASSPWINFWLPPSCSYNNKNIYFDVLKDVISLLRNDQLFTFISSTSIFGNKPRVINEHSLPDPETENAKLLVCAEDYIKKHLKLYHIIRPSGLIDEERHPINSLAGKSKLKDTNSLVNLVHSADVVGFIWHLRNHPVFSKKSITTHISCYSHLPKKIFYENSARLRSLPIPEFFAPEHLNFSSRKILSDHLWQKYHYQLKHLHVD